MSKELKRTLRFVSLIAIPLCSVNSMILSFVPPNCLSDWSIRFLFSLILTFPQAVFYVSLLKWFDNRRKR